MFRLKTAAATGTYGSITYNYDDVGNRTSVVDGATETYSTAGSSNRLLSVTSSGVTRDFSYDGAGNIIEDDDGGTAYGLAYNKANRLVQVSLNGTPDTDYLYNALGERVKKAPVGAPSAATHFHYDRDGKVIAESSSTGGLILEYAWLDGLPIAEFTAGSAGTPPATAQVDNGDGGAGFTGDWTTATAGSGYIGSNYRQHAPEVVPAGGTVIDNSGANFSATGIWPTATSPAGFEGSDYQARDKSADGFGSEIIVDNTDAGFSATGTWTASTNLGGYWGTNYLRHSPPNQIPPDSIIIDNADAAFGVFGTWGTGDTFAGGGKWGADYRFASPNQAAADSVIIDNDSANTSMTGTWGTATSTGKYGSNYRHFLNGTGTNSYTWTPPIASAEQYNVYAWWRDSSSYSGSVPFTIHHDGGSSTVTVDQRINGSRWNLLGTYSMTPGQNHRIVVADTGPGYVIADAVMITPVDGLNRAVWTPTLPSAASYNLYAWWRQSSSYNSAATFAIHHDGGRSTVAMNQETNGGQWNHLGAFAMTPGQNHRIELTDQSTAPDVMIADAARITAVGALPPTATWTPTLPRRDRYLVYARWEGTTAGYATNAPYTVYHEGGSTTITVNQQQNDSTWMLLGTFTMAPGQNHRVGLADTANGTVTADAVKFVPESAAKTATWTVSVGSTGSYKVYAKWPAATSHATDAQFTVTHAGGSTAVTANQRVNGGQWNLLGEFTFNSGGTGYKVELSDQVTNGKVIADAIYIAATGGTPSDAFTWTPTIPSNGIYHVYARWPASSANTGVAQYTVTHGGGTANVTLNQKQNGGAWMPLGSWSFAPGSGHKVTLAAAADGTTIADAMLFVAAGAQPANLLYVHPAHLGSPQKLTDASQATVWDGVFDPFGEEVAITGLAAMPLRFPGQYADEETGFSYNYFRDYEPTLGRYVQSDPMGVEAGVNTYAYVDANPVNYFDPIGYAKKRRGHCSSFVLATLQALIDVNCSRKRRCNRTPTLPPWRATMRVQQ